MELSAETKVSIKHFCISILATGLLAMLQAIVSLLKGYHVDFATDVVKNTATAINAIHF